MNQSTNKRRVFTVSRLNQEVQKLLESGFGTLWLQGELSNFSRPASGHFYFSLKDSQSQIRCAMFRGRNRYVDFKPTDGDEVLVRGKLGLYSARGDFQLIVEHMEAAGAGKLQQAFEATRRQLQEAGWFDPEHKQTLPDIPQSIGIITSATGAALQDVRQVLARRYPHARIVLYPTLVQGAQAASAIAQAIDTADRRNETDVLLLVRGGGSLEDLWAFNEMAVAEAIRRSRLPIVSGVGHEVDVTIADLVADLRAPTPSAAAELATPEAAALQERVGAAFSGGFRALDVRLQRHRRAMEALQARLQACHPERRIRERSQRVDELEGRLLGAWQQVGHRTQWRLAGLQQRLQAQSPALRVEQHRAALRTCTVRLNTAQAMRLTRLHSRLDLAARGLDTVSPLATLDRGFSISRRGQQVLTDVADVQLGDTVTHRLAHGEFDSEVTHIYPDSSSRKRSE